MICIFPPFFSSGPFRSSLVFLCTPAGPELPGLSYPTLLTLRRFYSGRSHKRDSPLFLDADAAVEALQNPPEWTEDENINTTELKPTHFLNFLLYTTDAGRPENNTAHNRARQNTSS